MSYLRSNKNDDVLVANGFNIEINGQLITGVVNVGGFSRKSGTFEWVDGGTGISETFIDQKHNYGPITMKYRVDPSKPDFVLLRNYVTLCMTTGVKINFSIIKFHFQKEIFRIMVYKALFPDETISGFDVNSSTPLEVDLNIPCSFWEIV